MLELFDVSSCDSPNGDWGFIAYVGRTSKRIKQAASIIFILGECASTRSALHQRLLVPEVKCEV